MSIQKVSGAEFVSFAYGCSSLLLSALYREKPQAISTETLKDEFEGSTIYREFRNNFQDEYNLYLMDKLMIPLFRDVLEEARRRNMGATIEKIFGAEGMYAIEVLKSASKMSFNEINVALIQQAAERKEPGVRLVYVNPRL